MCVPTTYGSRVLGQTGADGAETLASWLAVATRVEAVLHSVRAGLGLQGLAALTANEARHLILRVGGVNRTPAHGFSAHSSTTELRQRL